jgi:phosphoglycolate phosphatase
MIRGLLFDKDGTLFDFQATWGAWAAGLLGDLFGPRAGEVAEGLGFELGQRRFAPSSPIIAETTEHVAELLLPLLPGWKKPALIAHMKARAAATDLVPTVPLVPLMAGLRQRGLALGLATNDDDSSARAHLARAGIAAEFGFVAGYDSGWGGKPAAGQVSAFLAWAGLAPAEAAIVGDSLHDLHAGRAAGVRCVAVLTGPADAVLPDIGSLPAWLDRVPAEA